MFAQIPLFPEQASTTAERVDGLLLFLCAVTGSMAVLVSVLIIVFIIRYRRSATPGPTPRIAGSVPLELFWTIVPFLVFIFIFIWGADVYFSVTRPPDDAIEVYVVGKQWMWKLQHATGQREINELHVPVNRAVKLTLTSEDVIHDFGTPAFRTKIDVIPGRYTHTWYLPNRVGDYHLFCNQYCGTNHAGMIGWIHVMKEEDYDRWLNGAVPPIGSRADETLALKGRKLFLKMQCVTCHSRATQRAPLLEDLYMNTVTLSDGRKVIADDAFIRKSILEPAADVVQGWQPIMPTFKGQLADPTEEPPLSEEEALIQLIAFIKTLGPNQTPTRTEEFPAPVGAPTDPASRTGGQAKQP
jgi:cytochrome c oxidase subunit 2